MIVIYVFEVLIDVLNAIEVRFTMKFDFLLIIFVILMSRKY